MVTLHSKGPAPQSPLTRDHRVSWPRVGRLVGAASPHSLPSKRDTARPTEIRLGQLDLRPAGRWTGDGG